MSEHVIIIVIITIKDNTGHNEKVASTEKALLLHIETSVDTTLINSAERKSFNEDCIYMSVCEERIQSTLIRVCVRSCFKNPTYISQI